MRTNSPNRRASVATVFAVLLLAFTVFGWGTAYRLSLYQHDGGSSSTIPIAKLLSQKERPSTTKVVESLLPESPNHQPSSYYSAIIIVALMFGFQLAFSGSVLEVGFDDWRKQPHMSFFSFRPPPAFLSSH
jgi:hypothetical protein